MNKGNESATGLEANALLEAGVTGMRIGNIYVFSKSFRRKRILFVSKPGGEWIAACVCEALNTVVIVPLHKEQAADLLLGRKRPIDEVLPNVPRELREIFITGTTPAEFDVMMKGEPKPKEAYESLGYDFENREELMA